MVYGPVTCSKRIDCIPHARMDPNLLVMELALKSREHKMICLTATLTTIKIAHNCRKCQSTKSISNCSQ